MVQGMQLSIHFLRAYTFVNKEYLFEGILHTLLYIVTACYCQLGTSELFFICLRTSKTINLGELLVGEYD